MGRGVGTPLLRKDGAAQASSPTPSLFWVLFPASAPPALHVSHLWEYLHRHPGICLSIFWVFKKSTQSIFQLGLAISLE